MECDRRFFFHSLLNRVANARQNRFIIGRIFFLFRRVIRFSIYVRPLAYN